MPFFRIALPFIAVLLPSYAQCQQTQQAQSPVNTQPVTVTSAPLPPSPDDAPIPDLGAMPVPYNSSSRIKRTLRRLEPNCLDAIFHVCWSSPPAGAPVHNSGEKARVAEDLNLGDAYLKERNYRGAEFRFEDALQCEADNPEAKFKLAEALQNLGRKPEACNQYKDYLEIEPNGAFADRAKKSLQKLPPCPATVQ
jgi:tetratricopeptide (TPR) repeat protein